ncbi:hypothetical protein P3T76_004392 [Phytophthora citrophthora]|uniref:Cyclic nucleotide-binding domain-containing protein n=1 Tax=Phytophthora citrophthora TaxID=4793 RepID=A0AAD9LP80_9STRA|nr:hypothetical protein P3T76_004392 [Phytophthora citrophthora]
MYGPPLASESPRTIVSARTYSDGSRIGTTRGSSASHRKLRQELSYPATAQWAFLTSIDCRQHRSILPSRPSTARATSSEPTKLPKRPATGRRIKNQLRHEQMEVLTPRTAVVAIQEAVKREGSQEQYVNPLIGRSVEPRGQLGRGRSREGVESKTLELLSRARAISTMNATERLRVKAFQARANGEYDQAIKFYKSLSTARPSEIEAKFHLAVCLERTGQFNAALSTYKQVLKLAGGQHAFAYYNMGNLCMRFEKISKAIVYFTRAIETSKGDSSGGNLSSPGSIPVVFYRQRAAAYRKSGDFEKAAKDYVVVQKNAGVECPTTLTADSSLYMYTAESLYQTVQRAASPKKLTPQVEKKEEELKELDVEPPGHDWEVPESSEAEDSLTVWTLQRISEIGRLPPVERSDSDLQYLADFMQKRFSVCAVLHPKVCELLCRELVLSPEDALPARTPIFMEDEDEEDTNDHTIFFIFQGRVAISKTAGRMFQSKQQEEANNVQENDKCEQEENWESPWQTRLDTVSVNWKQSQLELCELEHGDVFGHQGRFTRTQRTYSAVTVTSSMVGALSWYHWSQVEHAQREAERERAARFLIMTPAFHGISEADIRKVACRASFIKAIGSKAVCCEGQSVDGLLIVREGELCQFSPCGLKSPPDMSISFSLSGALSEPQSARAFFIQLETAGDPLSFLRVNEAYHGFLPQIYVKSKQRELLRMIKSRSKKISNIRRTSVAINCIGTGKGTSKPEPVAMAVRRGDCVCISSAWVPPRQSRQETKAICGVTCAKATLVSVATAELLFLSSKDLLLGLSVESRSQLHRNLQDVALMDSKRKYLANLRTPGPPGGRKTSNLLEQFVRDTHWSKFKEELVENVLQGRT